MPHKAQITHFSVHRFGSKFFTKLLLGEVRSNFCITENFGFFGQKSNLEKIAAETMPYFFADGKISLEM